MLYTCTICGNSKVREDFIQDKSAKEGFRKQCKECKRKLAKKWCERNPEKRNAIMRKFRSTIRGAIHTSHSASKQRAKAAGLPFDLDLDYLQNLFDSQEGCCALTGEKMVPKSQWVSPSLDKIIPEKGYIKGNVQFLTQRANLMKSNLNNEQFIELCRKVVEKGSETIETTAEKSAVME